MPLAKIGRSFGLPEGGCSDFNGLEGGRWNLFASCAKKCAFSSSERESKWRKNGLLVELQAPGEPERHAYPNGSSTRFARRSFECWPMAKCRFPN